MPLPLAQRVSQPRGLRSGKNDTPSGETLTGRHRPSGWKLLKIPPGASPPILKFPHSTIPIFVWPRQNQQKSLYTAITHHGFTTMVMWPPLLPPIRPPVLIQTVICPVQEIIHVWDQVPECGKLWVWDGRLFMLCWSSHHTMNVGIQGIPPIFSPPTKIGSPHKAPWRGGTPRLPPLLSEGISYLSTLYSGWGVYCYTYSSLNQITWP